MSKEKKETNIHSMWPNYVKGSSTGQMYELEMVHHEASVYKKQGAKFGGIIFSYNDFKREKKKSPTILACDKDGNELPVTFYHL